MAYLRRTSALLIGLLLLSTVLAACTGGNQKIIRIGVVNFAPVLEPVFQGFKDGMTAFGYIEGVNVEYTYNGHLGGDRTKVEPEVRKFMGPEYDLVLAISTPVAQDTRKLIVEEFPNKLAVFASVLDPKAAGIVGPDDSYQRPGVMTGIRHGVNEAKRMEWLIRLLPPKTDGKPYKIFAPFNPKDSAAVSNVAIANAAAAELNAEVITRETLNGDEVKAAIADVPAEIDAIFIFADNVVTSQLPTLVQESLRRDLPMSVPNGPQVEAGGLIAYGFDFKQLGRQSARLVDQVLKGVPSGDLPVETAEFYLTINVAVANAIGLNISDDILRQADQIVRALPAAPTPAPTVAPTAEATAAATAAATEAATSAPTLQPTAAATAEPSAEPTAAATAAATSAATQPSF
jgi:putative tryptophan/tyrosine transport system substrate-binding protein